MHLYTPCVVQHVAFDMILITRYVSKWMVQMFMFWIYLKYICDRTRYCNLPCVLFYRKEQYYPHFVKYFPQFSSVQLLSCVQLFATPWTAARQTCLSITNPQSPPKPMSIESVMPSTHLSSAAPFSFWLQCFLAAGCFPMSGLFSSGGQIITRPSTSASVLPINI